MVRSAGKPIPGATVTATHGEAKVGTVTDRAGHYTLPPLGPGAWTVEVTMYGFEPARREVNEPQASRELDFNLTLRRSPVASAARAQAGNQVESQIQNELSYAE